MPRTILTSEKQWSRRYTVFALYIQILMKKEINKEIIMIGYVLGFKKMKWHVKKSNRWWGKAEGVVKEGP